MQRDPKMMIKCRRNAGRAARKRHRATRRRKAKLLKISQKNRERIRERIRRFAEHFPRNERKEAENKAQLEDWIIEVRGDYKTWWECTGCGYEVANNPPLPCPKCGGLNYEKIRQRRCTNVSDLSGIV